MTTLRVASFNMQYGLGWDAENPEGGKLNLEACIAAMQSLEADILLLQEVEQVADDRRQPAEPPNYSRIRAALAGYDSYFSYPPENPGELPFGYGLAIFSKTPLSETWSLPLPAPRLEFQFRGQTVSPTQRLLIGARTEVEGRPIQLLNTHLQAFFIIGHNSDHHPEQREILAKVLRQSQIPTLLGGDFNSAPGEKTIEYLETTGFQTVQKSLITWKRMPYVLDHIFYNDGFTLSQFAVIPTDAADHDILRADFSLHGI